MYSVMALQRGLTPAKAQQSPQLSRLRREAPGDLAEALGNLLTFTAQQFNVVRNLTDMQVMLLVGDLTERYWRWKLDEFAYVFREAVAGRWGKVYDRLDPPTVQEWCAAYDAERQEQIAVQAESEAAKLKAAEKDTAAPSDMARAYLKARMETLSDEDLDKGMMYYKANASLPDAALKFDLAAEILAHRWAAPAAVKPAVPVVVTPLAVPGLYDNLPDAPAFGS